MVKKKNAFSKEFLVKVKEVLLGEKERLEKELAKFTRKNVHVEDDYDASFPEFGDKEDENALEVAQYTTNKPL